jgi:hypothetical protein
MTVADLGKWAATKMGGGNLDPEVYQTMRADITADGKNLYKSMQAGFLRGDPYSPEDMKKLGEYIGLSDDGAWKEEVLHYIESTGNYPSASLAEMQKAMADADQNATSIIDRQILEDQQTVYNNTQKMLAENPLELGRRIGMEGVKDITPINFNDATAMGQGLAKNIRAGRLVAQKYGSDTVGMLTVADAAQFKSIVATGDKQIATNAMVTIADVPDDLLRGTLSMPDVRDALIGASQSRDFEKYSAAMTAMDKLYNRAPQEFARIFSTKDGANALDTLQDWQGRLRYYNEEEFKAEFDRQQNPQFSARLAKLTDQGSAIARTVPIVSISKSIGGPVPTDSLMTTAMTADYEKIYSQRYAATGDASTAASQTIERMKHQWGTSVVNNGELMLHPPESYYPSDENPNHKPYKWLEEQLTADLTGAGYAEVYQIPAGPDGKMKTVTEPWPNALIPDATTESEASAGKPPSYQVFITNPDSGLVDVARDSSGKPLRMVFDSSVVQQEARGWFARERARILANPPYVYHARRGY